MKSANLFSKQALFSKQTLAIFAISGLFLMGLPILTLAGGNAGLVIFSGEDRKDILDYHLDYDGRPEQTDRYRLYIPGKKLTQGASKFYISYPGPKENKAGFDGQFDTNAIEVRVKDGVSVPIRSVVWDKESNFLEITPETPIDPNTKVEIVLSNVRNPSLGTYYFISDVLASGDIPVRLFVGAWIISISKN